MSMDTVGIVLVIEAIIELDFSVSWSMEFILGPFDVRLNCV